MMGVGLATIILLHEFWKSYPFLTRHFQNAGRGFNYAECCVLTQLGEGRLEKASIKTTERAISV